MSNSESTSDDTKCISLSSDTAGLSCGHSFAHKSTPGLCAGCSMLAALDNMAAKKKADYPRCVLCGVIYRDMGNDPDGHPTCGPCLTITNTAPPRSALALQQESHRSSKMSALSLQRLQRPGAGAAAVAATGGKLVTPNSPFFAIETVLGGGSGKSKAQSVVSLISFNVALDDTIWDDVIEMYLKAANVPWVKRHEHNLIHDDIQITFCNAMAMHCDEFATIQQFIDAHLHVAAAREYPVSVKNLAKKYPTWPGFIFLEFHIQADLFTHRTTEALAIGNNGKRKANVIDASSKRGRFDPPAPVVSSFKPRKDIAAPPSGSAIVLRLIGVAMHDNSVAYDDSTRQTLHATISDEPLGQGTMKVVHSLEAADGKQYVAKRFYRDSIDSEHVSLVKNSTLLQEELMVIGEITHMLKAFYVHSSQNHVEVDKTLAVTTAWRGTEDVDDGTKPCSVANVSPEDLDMAHARGVDWLVEPRRRGAVQKWSGTVPSKSQATTTSRLAATITAFVHFAYVFSQKSMVFCDVQTMRAQVDGKSMNVVFDPMMHTLEGHSGPGDHGKQGIELYCKTHQCNTKCRDLGLEEFKDPDSDSDDAGNEND
ncbi:kinase-like domain-containing protein [Mycena pura]|uniref:Kinase-like domain-containing protein n=1 Tax=Mycena pura TaxID=153505 RepID=A0AAD6UN83_9AGAR|nr:kinase-like domain-containing protein [Mycena pura]